MLPSWLHHTLLLFFPLVHWRSLKEQIPTVYNRHTSNQCSFSWKVLNTAIGFWLIISHLRPFLPLKSKGLCLFLILFFIVCILITCLSFPLHRPLCDPGHSRLWAAFWGGHRKLFERSFRRTGFCEDPESFLCVCTRQWQQEAEVLCTHDSVSRHLQYHWEAHVRNLSSISWVFLMQERQNCRGKVSLVSLVSLYKTFLFHLPLLPLNSKVGST